MRGLTDDILRQMIAEDEFGLLNMPVKAAAMTSEDRLLARFNEIVDFVVKNGREPDIDANDLGEKMLAMRLKAIAGGEEQRAALQEFDAMGLLKEPEPPKSIEEALAGDDFGLLEAGEDLHTLTHVPRHQSKAEHIAQRKRCEDFDQFEQLFKDVHSNLRTGRSTLKQFKNPKEVRVGHFFVVNGMVAYIAAEGERAPDAVGKPNARLRVIFENGTESGMLLQSLAVLMYKGNGRTVTEPHDVTMERMGLEADTKLGSVYVLRSLSDDAQVKAIADLHKIGSTSRSADARVAQAEKHATFLNAPVEVIAEYQLPAVGVRAVEGMLHKFFETARLNMWFEREGINVAEPHEWFDVPLAVIDEAVQLIQAETITNYQYDRDARAIVLAE